LSIECLDGQSVQWRGADLEACDLFRKCGAAQRIFDRLLSPAGDDEAQKPTRLKGRLLLSNVTAGNLGAGIALFLRFQIGGCS
jgi:hypothetical protein